MFKKCQHWHAIACPTRPITDNFITPTSSVPESLSPAGGVLRRVLTVVVLQFLVEFGVLGLQAGGLLEEAFGGDGEELGRLGGAVGVEHGGAAAVGVAAELIVLGAEDAGPGDVPAAVLQDRGAV